MADCTCRIQISVRTFAFISRPMDDHEANVPFQGCGGLYARLSSVCAFFGWYRKTETIRPLGYISMRIAIIYSFAVSLYHCITIGLCVEAQFCVTNTVYKICTVHYSRNQRNMRFSITVGYITYTSSLQQISFL